MMVLYGGGGHACVVFEALLAAGETCLGVFDDALPALSEGFTCPFLGPYHVEVAPDSLLIIAVGDNARRKILAGRVRHRFGVAAHPSAVLSPSARLGAGVQVLALAVVHSRAVIGPHVIVNTGAIVEHDTVVEAFAHLAPRATLCGGVRVGEAAFIGPGAIVTQGVSIGAWSQLGAGSVALADVPPGVLAAGAPARVIRAL